MFEVTSQSGQLNLGFPSGYGFTAIIVSFLGRLHPIGAIVAGLVLAISYVGGQVAQIDGACAQRDRRHLPGDDAVPASWRATCWCSGASASSGAQPRRKSRGSREMIVDFLIPLRHRSSTSSTPILLAATGELVAEKSGVLNLGVEGMMLSARSPASRSPSSAAIPHSPTPLPGSRRRAVARRRRGGGRRARWRSLLFGFIVLTLGCQSGRDRPGADDLRHAASPR